jgi:hypothetical protein
LIIGFRIFAVSNLPHEIFKFLMESKRLLIESN